MLLPAVRGAEAPPSLAAVVALLIRFGIVIGTLLVCMFGPCIGHLVTTVNSLPGVSQSSCRGLHCGRAARIGEGGCMSMFIWGSEVK